MLFIPGNTIDMYLNNQLEMIKKKTLMHTMKKRTGQQFNADPSQLYDKNNTNKLKINQSPTNNGNTL